MREYSNKISFGNQVGRLVWCIVWFLFARPIPRRFCRRWKVFLLNLFGANIDKRAVVYSSVKIYEPWNLSMDKYACLASEGDCYNPAYISIGAYATVSQKTYLCSASHDITRCDHQLLVAPIIIEDQAWVGTDAFIGLGVTIRHFVGSTKVIAYIGRVVYFNEIIKTINLLRNDIRFEFHIHGTGFNRELTQYVVKNAIKNVWIHGAYQPCKKKHIIKSIDVLFNVYGNQSSIVKYAILNKFYDSIFYRKPILVSSKTTMEERTRGFSFSFDFNNSNLVDNLYKWYKSIDAASFNKLVLVKVDEVINDNKEFKSEILSVLSKLG